MNRLIKPLLIVMVVLDVVSFQYHLFLQAPKIPESLAPTLSTLQVNKLPYVNERSKSDPGGRTAEAWKLIARPDGGILYTNAYGFLQADPCVSQFKTHFTSKQVARFLGLQEHPDPDSDRMIGCGSPKLRLVPQAALAGNSDEAADLIKELPDLSDTVVVVNKTGEDPFSKFPAGGKGSGSERIAVKEFRANAIAIDLVSKDKAWLVYADAFHPGWQAFLNGRKVPVYEAYLGFKAVPVPAGASEVRMVFQNGLGGLMSSLICAFGLFFGVMLVLMLVKLPWAEGKSERC